MRSRKSMLSHTLTKVVIVAAALIAIGGGTYGIVSATASTGSGAAPAATSPPSAAGRLGSPGGGSNARSGPAAGGSTGTVESVSTSSLTLLTSAGQTVTVEEAPATEYKDSTTSISASAIDKGERVLVLGMTNGTTKTITASQVIVQDRRRIDDLVRGGAVPAWRTVHVKAGRADPGKLQAGDGYDRQRNGGEQGDRSRAGRLPGWHRRPRREAEQRRVRSSQHRRQLAPPCLRQQDVQGRRRRVGECVMGAWPCRPPISLAGANAVAGTRQSAARQLRAGPTSSS